VTQVWLSQRNTCVTDLYCLHPWQPPPLMLIGASADHRRYGLCLWPGWQTVDHCL